MVDTIVMGGGVAGLGTALALGRRGHRVTVLERDATPLPADPHGAFEWDRRGAPQVRHSHAFLARLRNLLRDHYPDVLSALLDAGATEMDFVEMLPDGMDRTRVPGDEDLVALACRRTTFEWVLRRVVTAEGHVEVRDGSPVARLVGTGLAATGRAATPVANGDPTPRGRVAGVVLDDGTELRAQLVVAAGGRRDGLPRMLAELGVEVREDIEDTGIIYFSRFFRLLDGFDFPQQNGPIGGDLGYLKYGVFPGDNRTFSITLSSRTDDSVLRSLLLDPDQFLAVAAELAATAAHVDGRSEPITGVEVMAKLLNRRRRMTHDDGTPLIDGIVAVGDAHTCTNPLYGRGCSLAMVQADLLADALAEHGDDLRAAVVRYEADSAREIFPWYRAAVAQDAMNRADAAAEDVAEGDAAPGPAPSGEMTPDGGLDSSSMRLLLRDGLLPAMRVDPVVIRAFLRMFNLLEAPDALLTNWDVLGRVMAVYQERSERPPEPPLGPDREGLLAAVALVA